VLTPARTHAGGAELAAGDSRALKTFNYMNKSMHEHMRRAAVLAAALGALAWGGPGASLGAQEMRRLTLEEAVAEARANHPTVAAAEARAAGAREQVAVAGAGRWPGLVLEGGVLASTDPVAAFGGRLRQGRFTEADFDPARLNRPEALTDFDAALVLGWTPVDFSRDAGIRAARAGADAAGLGAAWTERVAGYQAEVRYVEAAGAAVLLTAAEAALQAAEANFALVTRQAEEGLVTDADVLRARAALEQARVAVIRAEQGVTDARARLGLALGWSPRVVPVPAIEALVLGAEAPSGGDGRGRTDLTASEQRVAATAAMVDQASRARIPTVQGFARLEAHTDDAFTRHGDSWTVGLRVSVPVFSGFEVRSRRDAARAEHTAAALEHDHALDQARTQLAELRRGAESGRRAALAAEAGAEAAREAARLVRLRFEEGLATTAELLAAEASAVHHEGAAVQARLDHRLVVASLLLLDDPRLDITNVEGANR